MSERGRSEPARAQAPEKAPPVTTPPLRRTPPPPPEETRRRPSRFRRIIGTGLVAAAVGTSAFLIPKAIEQTQGQEGPGPTRPRPTEVEPTPTGPSGITGPEVTGTTGPSVEPTKPPPFERTGEFAAELGYTSPRILAPDDTVRVYSEGILADIKRQPMDIRENGEVAPVWVFKFYFGQDAKGNPIYMNFSWGPDEYNAWALTLPGAKAPITASLGSESWEEELVDASVLKTRLENKIGHEFGLELTVEVNSGPDKGLQVFKDSADLIEALEKRNSGSEERIKIDRDNIGFLSGIYFPPAK